MKQLLVATRNQGKLHELTDLLKGSAYKVVSLSDLGIHSSIEETGKTFAENAVLKAVQYSRLTDALTLADDSGLVVDALAGAPGVQSARYGGMGLTDEQRCLRLLEEIENVSWEDRKARFVCVLALARTGELIRQFEGIVEGRIAFELRGKKGFGYDPIFYYPRRARTFGEMTRREKDKVSHRGQALVALRAYFDQSI